MTCCRLNSHGGLFCKAYTERFFMSCTSRSCIKLSCRGSAVPHQQLMAPVLGRALRFLPSMRIQRMTRSLSQDTADDVARSHQCEAPDPRIPRRWRDSAAIQQHLPSFTRLSRASARPFHEVVHVTFMLWTSAFPSRT